MSGKNGKDRRTERSRTYAARGKPRRGRGRGRGNAPEPTRGSSNVHGFAVRAMPFFGYKVRKQMPYYTFGAITSGASNLAGAYVFSANGCFDPDITGTGGQPMSFDQAMLFFNHYTVHKCTIKVTFMSDAAALRSTVGLFVSGSSSVTTSLETLIENGDGAIQKLNPASVAESMCTFRRTLDVGKFQSVDDVMDDPNMRGDSASNPTEQAYFHLVVYNTGTTATVQVDFEVELEYDVTFHEPRKGTISLQKRPHMVHGCSNLKPKVRVETKETKETSSWADIADEEDEVAKAENRGILGLWTEFPPEDDVNATLDGLQAMKIANPERWSKLLKLLGTK